MARACIDTPTSRRQFARRPCRITRNGLAINQKIHVFGFEKSLQRRAARHISDNHQRICNIGYGLGFAHQEFLKNDAEFVTIELNRSIYRRAVLRHENDRSNIVCSSWQDFLLTLPTYHSFDAIFFDPFPTHSNFNNSARGTIEFITGYLNSIQEYDIRSTGYFLLFHNNTITLPYRDRVTSSPIFTIAVADSARSSVCSRVSLVSFQFRPMA